jgi:hypothetical protein
MFWSTPIDLYCERTDPTFWSEPVNALTNLAFLIAAAAALRQWRRAGSRDIGALLLIIVTAAIGLGSFAFHTLATRGAVLLDVIPIALFIYGYLLLALRRFLGLAWLPALAWLIGFIIIATAVPRLLPPDFLNGSGGYLPALIALFVVGVLAYRRDEKAGRALLTAGGILAVSIVFRSIDLSVCPKFPLGTHFIWHVLNALVLYLLLRAAIDQRAPSSLP